MTSWQGTLFKVYFHLNRLLRPSTDELDVDQERTAFDGTVVRLKPRVHMRSSPVQADTVAAEWEIPHNALADRVVLYLHGGAYCVGSLDSYRGVAGLIGDAAEARALLIDYRLAPEHSFPAAVQDALTAYTWLLEQGTAPEQVALVGDSAGGGLLLALMVSLRNAGQPLPVAGVCISPWTDLSMSGRSWTTNARREVALSPVKMRQMAQAYLDDADPRTPLASPLHADLAELPPLLIHVGSDECLLSDAEDVAVRAKAAGVDVELEVWPGMFHGWHIASRFLPEGRQVIERIGAFLRPRFAEAA